MFDGCATVDSDPVSCHLDWSFLDFEFDLLFFFDELYLICFVQDQM